MGQDEAINAPFAPQIVPPAVLAGPAGTLLTRGEVARRLGLSLSTVRRKACSSNPSLASAVSVTSRTEIQTVLVRVRRTRVPVDERADGTLAAAAFTRFRNGADVVAVVTELPVAPEKIESLFEHWKRLRGTVLLDAMSLTALAGALGAPNLTDENALLSAVSEFKKSTGQQCVLCEQEPAYWCRNCAQEAGRADAIEREVRMLF